MPFEPLEPNGRRRVHGAELELTLLSLRARDADFCFLEPTPDAVTMPGLSALSTRQLLVLSAASGRNLFGAIVELLQCSPEAPLVCRILAGPFPPDEDLPGRLAALVEPMAELAMGLPGAVVEHGLFPSRPTKLARLLLAKADRFSPNLL